MARKPPPRTSGQHHGDLRRALLETATRMVEGGEDGFSLRELARRAGVTSAAPYHHFPDKAAVLDQVAIVGFQRLDEELARASAGPDAAAVRLTRMVEAYLRFSAEHAAHYRLMFPPELGSDERHHELRGFAEAAFGRLVAAVTAVRPTAPPEALFFWAFSVWALCHGFLMLHRDGLIDQRLPFGSFEVLVPRIAALSAELVFAADATRDVSASGA
jgi:AcrR family transcriptional regulator